MFLKKAFAIALVVFSMAHLNGQNKKDLYEELQIAVENGNVNRVKEIINTGINTKQRDYPFDNSYLYYAKNKEICQLLLDDGLEVNTKNNSGYSPLHWHLRGNANFETLKLLIENGADVNAQTKLGDTPLHLYYNDINICRFLIENGADLSIKDNSARTPLYKALLHSPLPVIRYMINQGAEINIVDTYLRNALHTVCTYKRVPFDVYRLLVSKECNVNALDFQGQTPLHLAVKNGIDSATIHYLLANGSKTNVLDIFEKTPLSYATDSSIIKLLKHYGALDPNLIKWRYKRMYKLLHKNHISGMNKLLNKGIDINHKDNERNTFLHLAIRNNAEIETIRFLIEKGLDINEPNKNNQTVMDFALIYKSHKKVVQLLINEGVDINPQNNYELNYLHKAIMYNADTSIMKKFIDSGVDLNAEANNYGTVLRFALYNKCKTWVLKFLINNGAKVDKKMDKWGLTPLGTIMMMNGIMEISRLTVEKEAPTNNEGIKYTSPFLQSKTYNGNSLEKLKLLIESGANVKAVNQLKQTALHAALLCNGINLETLRFLIDKGVDINAKDNNGTTPLHIAIHRYPHQILEMLLQHGADPNIRYNNGNSVLQSLLIDIRNKKNRYIKLEYIKLLIKYGAELKDEDKYGNTILNLAIRANAGIEIIGLLLKNGAIADMSDLFAISKLNYQSSAEIVNYLNEHNIDLSNESYLESPLRNAIKRKEDAGVIKKMLKTMPDFEWKDKNGTSLLKYAFWNYAELPVVEAIVDEILLRRPDYFKGKLILNEAFDYYYNNNHILLWLIEKGVDVNVVDGYGNTPLMIYLKKGEYQYKCDTLLIESLLKNGANVNAKNHSGNNALASAIIGKKDIGIIKILLKYGAEINCTDEYSHPPSIINKAIKTGDLELVKLLIDNGADLEQYNSLHYAVLYGNLEIIQLIIKTGCNINNVDKNNETALFVASANPSHYNLVEFLIENGININIKNKKGETCLHRALQCNTGFKTVELLVNKGVKINERCNIGRTALYYETNQKIKEFLLSKGATY